MILLVTNRVFLNVKRTPDWLLKITIMCTTDKRHCYIKADRPAGVRLVRARLMESPRQSIAETEKPRRNAQLNAMCLSAPENRKVSSLPSRLYTYYIRSGKVGVISLNNQGH